MKTADLLEKSDGRGSPYVLKRTTGPEASSSSPAVQSYKASATVSLAEANCYATSDMSPPN